MRWFNNDLGFADHHDYITLGIDNEAAEGLTRNPITHDRAKHIDIQYHFIRERVTEVGHIRAYWVPTVDNLADILTKALSYERFADLRG